MVCSCELIIQSGRSTMEIIPTTLHPPRQASDAHGAMSSTGCIHRYSPPVDVVHGLTHDLVHVASGEIDHPATVLAIWHEQRCRLLKMDIGIGNEGRGSHKIRF
jgi:hypothetical protein